MPTGVYIRNESHLAQVRSLHKLGVEHQNWKGNSAKYRTKHTWLIKNYGKANKCENRDCLTLNPNDFEWSNISGEYKRDLSDWSSNSVFNVIEGLIMAIFVNMGMNLHQRTQELLKELKEDVGSVSHMSNNIKVFTEYDRFEVDRKGRKIHIWRQITTYLSKREVQIARENREKMKVTV